MDKSRHAQSGSALVLILIAVALFAALSYAMMRDSGTGAATRTMSDARARLLATEIIQYGDTLARTVQKLRIRGCSETEFDFSNDVWARHGGAPLYPSGHYSNARSPDCSVFHPQGGGAAAINIPKAALQEWAIAAHNTGYGSARIRIIPLGGVGENDKEDVYYTTNYLHKEVCLMVNRLLGVENPGDEPPFTSGSVASAEYTGAFNDRAPLEDPMGVLKGKRSFCASTTNPSPAHQYNFWQLLVVR
ncbi:MAG: hypothetical protein WC989_01265 [Micavibrio sp.]